MLVTANTKGFMCVVCIPCTSIHMNLALSSNHSCSALLIHCLFCSYRSFSWGLTSSLHWCPACKIASRPRLAQVRDLCVSVTITLPAPALPAGLRAVQGSTWKDLGSFQTAEGHQGQCLHWALRGRAEGLCHC